ncbi:DUF6397 family protein [Streptomyces sp. NBC_01465]|uniref:DUF6397 family protein n=1 Tax=Streptomyces sp. NBC_01465 TaxID=2903878 RepID=UPI002E32A2F8|nr:DUF6397 family protein [Streptomyces sp. NBC_01465]
MTVKEQQRTTTAGTSRKAPAAARAAQELMLKRGEFDLAVQLGHIRTVTEPGDARRRVAPEEIERLQAQPGFPDTLRERIRTVGTADGAELLGISTTRFTALARTGHVTPVRFYLNRYRAVVWLYLAEELRAFASREPGLLTGTMPKSCRAQLDAGEDWRPRNWRGRRLGMLLRQTEGAWERAAVMACVLDPVQLAEVVDDPYERAHLRKLQPDLAPGRPPSPAAWEATQRLLAADNPDELLWHRMSLVLALDDAREAGSAPHPDGNASAPPQLPPTVRAEPPQKGWRSLLGLRAKE